MPVITNQPSPQVINPYWQKQVVSEKQEQRSEEIPEFVRENPSLLPWYRRTMESAANRGVKSVTFRQVPVREEVQEQEVPDAFKQDANLSNWYGRVMESARERGASNVTFTTVPAQPKESEMPDFFKENPSLQPWYQRVMASAAEREVKSVSFAFLEVPKSVASETKYPRTDVGLALKLYPMVSGFLGSIGQSFVGLGLEEWDIIQYNIADPMKAIGPKTVSYPITAKEKQIQQERTDIAIFGLSTAAFMVAPALIPAKIIGSSVASVAARTLIVSGVGAGTGYIYGGVEGAKIGALTAGIMYLGSVGATRGLKWIYDYVTTPKLPSSGVVDVPDIGYVAPRTMSEKVLGLPELKSPYQVLGFKALEAEATGMEMSIAPKTSAIDPLAKLIEPPTLTRPIPGMPYLPHPELTARLPSNTFDFLPKPEVTAIVQMVSTNSGKFVSASAFLGFEAFKVTKSTVKSQPSLSFSSKVSNLLSQPSRVDLALTPDVASMVEIVQLQKLEPLVETVQIQKPLSMTKMVSPTRSLYRFDFPKDISMMKQDFKVSHRKKRKSTSGLYLWEFPILDPEKVLRMT